MGSPTERKVVSQPSLFRGYVSFRECKWVQLVSYWQSTMFTWMSQEVRKQFVSGSYPQYTPFISRAKWGYDPLILTIDPNFLRHPNRDKDHPFFHHQKPRGSPTDPPWYIAPSEFPVWFAWQLWQFDGGWRWRFGGEIVAFFFGEGLVGWLVGWLGSEVRKTTSTSETRGKFQHFFLETEWNILLMAEILHHFRPSPWFPTDYKQALRSG